MPNFDRTGPLGQGPMTGRGAGQGSAGTGRAKSGGRGGKGQGRGAGQGSAGMGRAKSGGRGSGRGQGGGTGRRG